MNAQIMLEKFSAFTPRQKTALFITATLIVLLVVIGIPLATYYIGKSAARATAENDYLRDRDKNLKKIETLEQQAARHAENEKQLAAENALLKKQNEATAEILRANDAVLRGDTTKFTELLEKRNEKLKEINADDDFDSQLCGLCADGIQSGLRPFSFCERCQANP